MFVEARKSIGKDETEPLPEPEPEPALDVGLLTDCEGGRIGLSLLKKLDRRFRTAGEDGMFCRVSIVRSDNDGRGRRGKSYCASSSTTVAIFSSGVSCSSLGSGFTGRRAALEGFLNRISPLGFLRAVCGAGL